MATGLDDLDQRLIGLLRVDGRCPTATLARRLGVSRGTVQNRIDRLLRDGVLLGFTARLRGDEGRGPVRAIISIELRAGDLRTVVAALGRLPDVGRIHSTNGRWDMVAEIDTADLASLDATLTRIRAMKEVAGSETSILLAELS